ncbi:antigen peptide transporter 1-like [Pipra filicauda]|uniref:Antigen peptide transporter 1-like n=1 Tax=Pipra filicauda TaxID=649802 RepID=A0A6J2IMS6_9PASS|nr:antigen peptide transporter 1-like [Pipra filicauda]
MLSPAIRRLLALLRPECGQWALVGVLMVASALGEVAGPYFTGHITDQVTQEDTSAAMWPLVVLGLGSALTELVCDGTAAVALTRARARLQCGVVAAVLRGDVPGPGGSLGDTPGAVAARVTGDAEAAHAALADAVVPALWALARAGALLAVMASLAPLLALVTLLVLPLLLLLPRAIAGIQQVPRGTQGLRVPCQLPWPFVTSVSPVSPPCTPCPPPGPLVTSPESSSLPWASCHLPL